MELFETKYTQRINKLEEFNLGLANENHDLKNKIQELERAISVLARSNSNWPLNVSVGDELLIDRLLRNIDHT